MSKTATFETGTNGNTIATSDTGSADAWNNVVIGSNVTIKYDNAHVGHGSLAAKFAASSSPILSYLEWTGLALTGTHYGRFYLYMTAFPTGSAAIVAAMYRASDSAECWEIRVTTAGKIAVLDGVGGTVTAASALSTNTLYRVEYKVVVGLSTSGSVEAHVYPGDSTTESTTLGATKTGGNTRSQNDWFRIGFPVANPGVFTWWCDDVVAGALSATGPATSTVTGDAALTGTGSLSATGVRTRLAAAALTGTGSSTVAGVRTRFGAAALTGMGTLAAAGTRSRTGAATLTGTGILAAAGSHTAYATAALTGNGTLTSNGTRVRFGLADLTGIGSLSATSYAGRFGAAALTGIGSLTAAGVRTRFANAALTGLGILTAVGTGIIAGAAHLTGAGSLTSGFVGGAETTRTRVTGTAGRTSSTGGNGRTNRTGSSNETLVEA